VALEDGLKRTIDWCRQHYRLGRGERAGAASLPRFHFETLTAKRLEATQP
jgi:hypothetical protein